MVRDVAIPEHVFRYQWGRVLAALIGFLGEFDQAEDAGPEALRAPIVEPLKRWR